MAIVRWCHKKGLVMNIEEKVSDEIKTAMKAKDKVRLNVLRYLKKLFIENKTSKKPISPEDIVISHAKKIRDSLSLYPADSDQHTEIQAEITVLNDFLPKQLEKAEVEKLIADIKGSLDNPNMGSIMKELSPQIKGKFDGKLASELVKEALA